MADQKLTLDQATLVLFNPRAQMRATLRHTLLGLGFRNILDFGNLGHTRSSIIERSPDLVILDLDCEKEGICTLVREIRHSKLCEDPFLVIIALSWHPSLDAVNSSMESGIDDIITMPISTKLLSERINTLIRHRKNFVVTSSYVGPDRRTGDRIENDPMEPGTLKVPNNLRYKAMGDTEAAASPEFINEMQTRINNQRLNRHAQRIVWLIDESLKADPTGTKITDVNKQRHAEIANMIEQLAYDLESQGYVEMVEICDSMENVLDFLRHSANKKFNELLRLHAFAVTATLMEREGAAELVIAALNEATAHLERLRS
ncbi:MAG: DNA-binding response OmpR family regulator, partial [Alphaproteobacteria bacterium]